MTKQITPTELAVKFDSNGRTVRKFLRSITPRDEQPGKGGRWSIDGTAKNVNSLRKQFNEWHKKQLEEAAARAAARAAEAANDAEVEVDETE